MSYRIAKDLEQALFFLRAEGGQARLIAGGTDLFLQPLPPALVDLTEIAGLSALREEGGRLMVGACFTHAAAAASSLLREKATALAEACAHVGSPQVRNMGTLGGNVVNAAPAADAAVALVALGARAVIVDTAGIYREEPVEDLYDRYSCSKVDSGREVLVRFLMDAHGPAEGSAFKRFASRRALSLPMFSVAAYLRTEQGCLREVRLSVAPAKPAPTRLPAVEKQLVGLPVAPETFDLAADLVRREITVRGSALRCSADYRRHLAGILAVRALTEAALRAAVGKAGAVG